VRTPIVTTRRRCALLASPSAVNRAALADEGAAKPADLPWHAVCDRLGTGSKDLELEVRGEIMRIKHLMGALATIGVIGAGVAGCSGNTDGTLNTTWTIGGTSDPNVCTRVHANQMRIVVFDPALFVQATQFAPCTDFHTQLVLSQNTYTASLTFLDNAGVPVSETRTLAAFEIAEDQFTNLNIDFPLTAFFAR
jgi:hypothetical protein